MSFKYVGLVFFVAVWTIFGTSTVEGAGRIQDNSFLLEEAYNQEDGVIQHINAFQYYKESKEWGYTFTQEWPVPTQAHQLSYTIPVTHKNDPSDTGVGDIALNYRYQLIFKEAIACAPRFSILLPTGDYKKGVGSGIAGYQANLPLSIELSEEWVTHWNLGFTVTPDRKAPEGVGSANTLGFNFGTSFIYSVSNEFNLMFEAVWTSDESVLPTGEKNRNDTFFINPGMRFAINFESGLQIVPGIAVPIGIGPSNKEYGVFLYLSFEHPAF